VRPSGALPCERSTGSADGTARTGGVGAAGVPAAPAGSAAGPCCPGASGVAAAAGVAPLAAAAAGEVACRDAVGDQNRGSSWGGRAENVCHVYFITGWSIGAIRCHGSMASNEWQICNENGQQSFGLAFQEGRFYVARTERTVCKITAGTMGGFLFLPPIPRAGSPRTRKYTNAASSCARNSALYCGSLCSLEPTGVHFASNHGCKDESPTREVA